MEYIPAKTIIRDVTPNRNYVPYEYAMTLCGESERELPGAPVTSKRFEAIEYLSKCGITTGVLMDPIIPYLADIQRDYFYEEAEKIHSGIIQIYKEKYKEYYRCRSPKGKKLYSVFVDECEKQGINYNMKAANSQIRQRYKLYEKNMGK